MGGKTSPVYKTNKCIATEAADVRTQPHRRSPSIAIVSGSGAGAENLSSSKPVNHPSVSSQSPVQCHQRSNDAGYDFGAEQTLLKLLRPRIRSRLLLLPSQLPFFVGLRAKRHRSPSFPRSVVEITAPSACLFMLPLRRTPPTTASDSTDYGNLCCVADGGCQGSAPSQRLRDRRGRRTRRLWFGEHVQHRLQQARRPTSEPLR